MWKDRKKVCLYGLCVLTVLLCCGLSILRGCFALRSSGKNDTLETGANVPEQYDAQSNDAHAEATVSPGAAEDIMEDEEAATRFLTEDFQVMEGFHSNLPIVVLSIPADLPEYKKFTSGGEKVFDEIEPYVTGSIRIIDQGAAENHLSDVPVLESAMRIKKRGRSSFLFDKEQYLLKLINDDGTPRDLDVLGLGEESSWVLNGSMADKSMLRNYLAMKIASEVSSVTPDVRFCEVMFERDGQLYYQGLYLMMESVKRSSGRIDIAASRSGNGYSSYIVRRDRYTVFDTMLNTYGRLSGYYDEWIGVKYPSEESMTDEIKAFIEQDFSAIEQVIYSDKEQEFMMYDHKIDVDSFVDYFILNEFFGNYDAGLHSTYMYKNAGQKLKIGPVWDFDQAMNNDAVNEADPHTMAMQERAFFDRLTLDIRFLKAVEQRYARLRASTLSEEHLYEIIDETVEWIKDARIREWYRWADDYLDGSRTNIHNYTLGYETRDGVVIDRFNDNYDQEIYNIKVYLHKHGRSISTELKKLEASTVYDSSLGNRRELFLAIVMLLFLCPAILLLRRGG